MKDLLKLKDCILQGIQFRKDKLINTSLPDGIDAKYKIHAATKFSESSPYNNNIGICYVDYKFIITIQHKDIKNDDGSLTSLVDLSITVRLIFEFENPEKNTKLLKTNNEVREYIYKDALNITWSYWRQECLRLLAASGLPYAEIPLLPSIDEPPKII